MNKESLLKIKKELESDIKPEPIKVRTLLEWFDAKRRGWYVSSTIRKELKELSIRTEPDFESAYIDSLIDFTLDNPSLDTNKTDESQANEPSSSFNDSEESVQLKIISDPTYRISRLKAANILIISVNPDSLLTEAITKMIAEDFSQLPVMQKPNRDIKGYISWKVISLNLHKITPETRVRDIMDKMTPIVTNNHSLFSIIPEIIKNDFVIVKNEKEEITGIITSIDLGLQFRQLSEPFLLIGEIENHIRNYLKNLSTEDLQSAKNPNDPDRIIEDVSNLTFGEYVRLLQNPGIWEKVQIPTVNKEIFCKYLDEIRDFRNDIMHFDPEGLEEEEVEKLRKFVRLLQTIRNH